MIACVCLCLHIYIYMLVSGCKSSCTCVYVFLPFCMYTCIWIYYSSFFFFYGVAGKEDRKIKQLNEKWTFSRLLYVYIIHMYIYTLDVSSFNNRKSFSAAVLGTIYNCHCDMHCLTVPSFSSFLLSLFQILSLPFSLFLTLSFTRTHSHTHI